MAKYDQAIKRIHRPGQKKPCLYVHFAATIEGDRTIDQKILHSIKEKKSLVDMVMSGEETL